MNHLYPHDPKCAWRGDTICADMKTPLDERARVSGSDIYLRPIPGFGSYQSGSTASGRIAIRGGHVDLDLTRLSQAQALRLETLARCHGDADGMSATPTATMATAGATSVILSPSI